MGGFFSLYTTYLWKVRRQGVARLLWCLFLHTTTYLLYFLCDTCFYLPPSFLPGCFSLATWDVSSLCPSLFTTLPHTR